MERNQESVKMYDGGAGGRAVAEKVITEAKAEKMVIKVEVEKVANDTKTDQR